MKSLFSLARSWFRRPASPCLRIFPALVFSAAACAFSGCAPFAQNVSEIDPYAKVDISSGANNGGSDYSGEVGSRIVLRDPAGNQKSAAVVSAETVAPTAPVVVVPPSPSANIPVVPASTVPAGTPVAVVPAAMAAAK